MIKNETIYIPIYTHSLVILYGTRQEYTDFFRKRYDVNEVLHPDVTARAIEIKGDKAILWGIFINSDQITDVNLKYHEIVPHEVFHVVGMMMEYAGVKYDHNNDEAWAYLIGYISKNVFTTIQKFLK